VTTGAVGTKLAEVNLRIGVTTHARGRCSLIDVVAVTFGTDYINVGAGEGEIRLAMIKRGLLPVGGRVATGAVAAKGTFMHIILLVAGDTRAIGDLEIGLGAGSRMAEPTAHICVFTFEREAQGSMIETAVAIHTIVARQTVIAKISAVRGHKGSLIAHVATHTIC